MNDVARSPARSRKGGREQPERAGLPAEGEAQRRRLNTLVAKVPGVVWEAYGQPDAVTQRMDFVSEHVEAMLGYSVREWLATPNFWLSIVHPDDRERAAAEAGAIYAAGGDGISEFRWVARDGRVLWVEAHSSVIRDEAGTPIGMRGVTMDITGRKQEADRTARLQAVTAALSRALTPGEVAEVVVGQIVGGLQAQGGFMALLLDDRALELTRTVGYPRAVVEAWRRIPLDSTLPVAEAVRTGRPVVLESIAVDPRRYPLLAGVASRGGKGAMAAIPLTIGGSVVGGIGLSFVTPRRFTPEDHAFFLTLGEQCSQALGRARLYEAERAARREAEAAVRLRDEFLSVASHELKTPLTTLSAHAQLVLRSLEKDRQLDPLLVGRSLRSVTDQADRLNRLIARLLDISRLQAGRLVLECQEIDLKESVDGAAASAQARASQHRITVRSPARLAASVDPVRFEQVIANLLDNAIKYSPDGGPIELELTRPSAASVQLAVRDHGLGIPPERRSQIFDRFYQAHGEGYRSGMGLGLYISRQIVELHGGELWAEFPPDGGSRFVVRLPVRMAGLAATSGQSSDSDGSGPRSARGLPDGRTNADV